MNNQEIAKMLRECAGNAEKVKNIANMLDPIPDFVVGEIYLSTFSSDTPCVWNGNEFIFFDISDLTKEVFVRNSNTCLANDAIILHRFGLMSKESKAELVREWAKHVLANGLAKEKKYDSLLDKI